MALRIYIDNHNVIEWQALTNTVTSVVDTAAAVTVTLKDQAGVDVVGQVWPAAMSHDTGGTYRVTLDADLELVAGRPYVAHLDALGVGGEIGHKEITSIAQVRNQ